MNRGFRNICNEEKLGVIHVALNPQTGPWSVMRDLALAQARSGIYGKVAIGVIYDVSWPARYRDEALASGLPFFSFETPKLFGTASFLLQRVIRAPIEDWVKDVAENGWLENVVVHFHNAWMSGVFLPLKDSTSTGIRVVVTVHGVNAFLRGKPIRFALHKWMAGRLLKYPVCLTSVDHANLKRAESEFGLPPRLFTVIPNGVTSSVQRGCHYQHEGGGDRLTLAHVGSITPQKGWRVTAEAVVEAAAAGCLCRLVIAGTGPEEEQAKAFATANRGCIEFRGHVVNPRDTLMPKVDVLCLLSDHEGLPMSIIEAMSVGLPVIATDVGGVSEAVSHEVTGYLIPKSRDALVNLIVKLSSDRQTLGRLSQQALRVFSERFEIIRIVERFNDVYRDAFQTNYV